MSRDTRLKLLLFASLDVELIRLENVVAHFKSYTCPKIFLRVNPSWTKFCLFAFCLLIYELY